MQLQFWALLVEIEGQPVALHAQRTGDIDRFGITLAAATVVNANPVASTDSITMPNSALARLPVTERLTSNQGSFSQVGRVASFIRKQNYNFCN